MAWQWTDAKPFPEQYHFTHANLSSGFTVCYHDKNSLCNQNNRSYKQLSQRQPSVAVTVTIFYTWQYRLSLPSWCAKRFFHSWWRHKMETFSASLVFCAGNSPVPGEFPSQRPVTRNFDVAFDLRLNTRLCKQSWGWWFETPSPPLWRHRNVNDTLREGSSVTGSSPHKGQVMQSVYIFFVVILDKLLNKQPGWIWILMELNIYFHRPFFFK